MAGSSGFQFSVFTSLVRALFPRWDFFDRIAHEFLLEYEGPGSSGWSLISFDQQWRPWHLFLNASTNLSLAQVNVVEHFARDVQELVGTREHLEPYQVHALSTYQMLETLVRVKLSAEPIKYPLVRFRVVASNSQSRVEIYTSDWIRLEPS